MVSQLFVRVSFQVSVETPRSNLLLCLMLLSVLFLDFEFFVIT